MNDKFTEIKTIGWGKRIVNSLIGVLIGLLMFIFSFGLLYWNEGRIDISKLAKNSIEIETTSKASEEINNKLISVTSTLQSDEKIGDIFLKEGNYISIERNVEMYSWNEYKDESSQRNIGGSETIETTYSYKKEWTDSPAKSSDFKNSEGHKNPKLDLSKSSVKVKQAKIGVYGIDMNEVTLPQNKNLQLDMNNIILNNNFNLANSQYIYRGKGNIDNPEIGDIRVSYLVVDNPIQKATIFGVVDLVSQKIIPYYGTKNVKFYRIFEGDKNTAISKMQTEYTFITWALRGVGFLLMWIGLIVLFAPISVFLDLLPIFGSISRFGIAVMTFIVSFILSMVTILVSIIIHNLIILVIVISICIIGVIFYLKSKKAKSSVNNIESFPQSFPQ